MADTKLTTVKIVREVYAEFKRISFDSNITFQKLVNRSLHKYINDTNYKDEINNYTQLQESGSVLIMNKQDNGNTQLNQTRNEFNDRVESKKFLGNTFRVKLNNHRRFRII